MPPIAARHDDPLPRMPLQYQLIDAFIVIALAAFDWWIVSGIVQEWGVAGLVAGAGLIASGMTLIIWLDARRERRERAALLQKPTSTIPTASLRPVATVVRGPGAHRVPSVAGGRQLSSVGAHRPDPSGRLS